MATVVTGLLESAPSTDYRIELFTNAACDPAGSGEGADFLGALDVTTAADGSVAFEGTFASNPPGPVVTATATDPLGNTSEFSPCDTSKVISVIPADNALVSLQKTTRIVDLTLRPEIPKPKTI